MDLIWGDGGLIVAGPDTARLVPAAAPGRFAGLRFAPGAGPALLGVPAHELRDAAGDLDALWARRRGARGSPRGRRGGDPDAPSRRVARATGGPPPTRWPGDRRPARRRPARGGRRRRRRPQRPPVAAPLPRRLRLRPQDARAGPPAPARARRWPGGRLPSPAAPSPRLRRPGPPRPRGPIARRRAADRAPRLTSPPASAGGQRGEQVDAVAVRIVDASRSACPRRRPTA